MTNTVSKPNYTIEELVAFEAQLKSCPHCKGTDIGLYGPMEAEDGSWDWMIHCDESAGCDGQCMQSHCHKTPEEAIAAWNNSENMLFEELKGRINARLRQGRGKNPAIRRKMSMTLNAPQLELILKIFEGTPPFFDECGDYKSKVKP